MKFLLYTTTYGKSGSIQLNRPLVWMPALLVLSGLLLGTGWIGHRMASQENVVAELPVPVAGQEQHWQQALEEQKQELRNARKEAQDHLNALAVRLGQMQAQMLRVDALGQRLSETAQLSKFEFDFDQLPAQGGPADSVDGDPIDSVDFMQALDDLALQMDDRARQLELLEQIVTNTELNESVSPAGRPVAKGWLSSYYGMRNDPFHGRRAMHKGVDFAGKIGSDIVATAAGVVTWAGKRSGYGQLVEVTHGNGYVTRYGHCKEIVVAMGDRVEPGQKIALMGSSGRSTGPHVHYEVLKDGKQVNPTKYVRAAAR